MNADDELAQIRQRRIEAMMSVPGGGREPGLLHLTDSDAESTFAKGGLVLVDFWAPWCGPCRMVAPSVEEAAKRYAGRVLVAKLNVDENPGFSMRNRVMSIPTLMLFKNGRPADKLVGAVPASAIAQMLDRHLA